MNKHVIACGFSILASVFVGVGCSSEVDDEEVGATSESELRAAARNECGQGDGLYCGGNGVNGSSRGLYRCRGGRVSFVAACTGLCQRMPDGQNDRCASTIGGGDGPPVSACASGNGLYCGGNQVPGLTNWLYSCTDGAVRPVKQCVNGCRRMPAGYNDQCN